MRITMFDLQFSFLILTGCILRSSQLQSIPIDWQSSANISSSGFQFSPVNEQALLMFEVTVNSLISCFATCFSSAPCCIFDFDGQSHRCRIFQGNITTMGSIVASSSSQSRVGTIELGSQQFVNHGQPCPLCHRSRYLTCMNSTCQCPTHTFFDGTICQSQKLLGAGCIHNIECRLDLNYACLSSQQCGGKYC
jgi:hypothetical protein